MGSLNMAPSANMGSCTVTAKVSVFIRLTRLVDI